jgi:LAO/AO transport system kinase
VASQQVRKALGGDRRALARLFTRIERSHKDLVAVMREVHPHTGRAYSLGITGPPGSGKSTIVDGLIGVARDQGKTVGVIAVDPTSPFSGGAVLGDRIRMQRHYLDAGVFIRSLATRGVHGGLSQVASAAVRLLDAAGTDLVIVETVGVGQTELDISVVADTVVVAMVPEGGDSVQAMKAGLMEIADIYVVNKADRDGASQLRAAIRGVLSLGPPLGPPWTEWVPPVLLTEAHTGQGIAELYDSVWRHRDALEASDLLEERRRQRRRREYAQAVGATLNAGLVAMLDRDGPLADTVETVESGLRDPYGAAAETLADPALLRSLTSALSDGERKAKKASK